MAATITCGSRYKITIHSCTHKPSALLLARLRVKPNADIFCRIGTLCERSFVMCTTTSIPIAAMLAPRYQPASSAKLRGDWALENNSGIQPSRKGLYGACQGGKCLSLPGYTVDVPFGLAADGSAISREEVWHLSLEKSNSRSSMAGTSSRPSGLVIAHSCMA